MSAGQRGARGERLPTDLPQRLGLMRHRGPDETSVRVVDDQIVLGFQRLAIVDVDGSSQPLSYPPEGEDAERWALCFNGELYNYRELRDELRREHGARFATNGDAEVVAAAYHYWGPEAVHRFRGMFAYALWDRTDGVLYAARDPFGIKPLYYLPTPDGLWLASEKKSLPNGRELDTDALGHYLSLQYVPEPFSLHAGVRRLSAGGRLSYRPGGDVIAERYVRPTFQPADSHDGGRPAQDGLVTELREALRDSVRTHLNADVPVGAFLSGGVDSTAVVALAHEVKPDLQVFSVGFDTDGYSECDLADASARELGVKHTPTVITGADVLGALPRIVWHLDDPLADPSLTPLYFLARTASEHVTVVLSGEGADELFGGYTIYREAAAVAPVGRLPHPLQRALRGLTAVLPEGVKGRSYLERATTPLEQRYYGNARMFDAAEKDTLLRHRQTAPRTEVTAPVYAEAAALDDVSKMQIVDMYTWLPGDILTKADRMSMAHSLELRVPFLDRRVFEVASRIPSTLRVPAGSKTTKYLLREAVRGIVPEPVTDRRKLGFATPTRVWLRGEMADWADDLLSHSGAGDLIDLEYVRGLLAAHRQGRADHARKIWTVLVFCLWYAMFIEHSLDPFAAPARPPVPA
ncbi:asparagine synthase (glutamine-hydrolyzing) [Rhizomonospora bruguierae]|uniref:asparagine synthase (glutamine-hydrolyzing) n=1 Tax=Rhizomonospora bruguierae TaxID=1581705 RepID=UPI001BCA97AB|nr:asparagine synthase (glutamine-hydrolyzing) [Micromonospora sp. NBRC 107566]